MPIMRHLVATCRKCEETTPVTEEYWPATRDDPADGQWDKEECSHCGAPFDSETGVEQDEPPEQEPHGDYDDSDWEGPAS